MKDKPLNELTFVNVEYKIGTKLLLGPMHMVLPLAGVTCVLGHNGAGKTLFLNICHGSIVPSRGTIEQNGVPVQKTRRKRGFIFQHNMIMRRSVFENIRFPLIGSGLSRRQQHHRVDKLLLMVQLSDRAYDSAFLLSGGEKQRMALARALVCNPKLILMDEPTSHLDPAAVNAFESVIQNLMDLGTEFIWATHDYNQAHRYATRVVFLEDGKLEEISTGSVFFHDPKSDGAKRYLKGEV